MEEGDEDGREALSYEVFCNSLIFRKIKSSLAWEDTMNLRAVSRVMNKMVLTDSRIVYETILILDKSSLKDPCFKTLSFQPKHLEICPFKLTDSEDDPRIVEIGSRVCKLAETCETLFVYNVEDKSRRMHWEDCEVIPEPPEDLPEEELDNIIVPHHCPPILQVVLATKHLKELRFAQSAELFLTSADQSNCLRELKHIVFSCIEGALFLPKLFLGIKGLEYIEGLHTPDEGSQHNINISRVHEMLKNNQDTLLQFEYIEYWSWKREDRGISSTGFLTNLFFPKWKSLSLHIFANQSEDVINFLKTHASQLETLILELGCGEALQVLYKCKGKLKHLSLTYDGWNEPSLTNEHCGAIKEIPLQTLSLDARRGYSRLSRQQNQGVIRRRIDILDLLPSSLQEFEQFYPFFYPELYQEVHDPTKLKNFPALKALRLFYLDEVTDEFIHAVCKHLCRLESLELISLKKLTDKAFVPYDAIIEADADVQRDFRPPISNL